MIDISGVVMLTVLVLTGFMWLIVVIQGHRLFFIFREKYPEVAKREIPSAFEMYGRDPERFLYFFRKKSAEFIQQDETLRKLKRQITVIGIISIALPVSFILCAIAWTIIAGGQ
jgi:hypothetical protein